MDPTARAVTGVKAKILSRLRNVDPKLADAFAATKLPWFTIRNADEPAAPMEGEQADPTIVGADIFIYDEIGGSFGVDANELVMAINDMDVEQINVHINSPGGSVFDAIAIYNSLVRHPANVTTYVDALAASAASIVAMGGDQCVMMVGSQMMIHDALGNGMGNAADFREMADFLGKQSDNLASIYAARAGGEIDEWRARMLAETWLFAQEAVDLGLADEIYSSKPTPTDTPEDAEEETEPDEDEDPTKPPGPNEPDEDDPEKDDPTKALAALMHQRHRLTNRGYKHIGRERAPAPLINTHTPQSLADHFAAVAKSVLAERH
jgi:ATP-dependent protease ClpP protease subunit